MAKSLDMARWPPSAPSKVAVISRAFALRRKLGATGGTGDYIAKPKGMHWRTFERAVARIRRAEDIVDMHEALLLGRLEESFPDKDR